MMTTSSLTKQLIKLKRVKLLRENVAKGPKKGLCAENMDVGVKLKRERPKADVGETGLESWKRHVRSVTETEYHSN